MTHDKQLVESNGLIEPGFVEQLQSRRDHAKTQAETLIDSAVEHEQTAAKLRADEAALQHQIKRLDAAIAILNGHAAITPMPDHAAIRRGVRRVSKQVYRATKKAQAHVAADKPSKSTALTTLDHARKALEAGPAPVDTLISRMAADGWKSLSKTPSQVVRTALDKTGPKVGIRRSKRGRSVIYRLEAAHA